ncbi:MAG: chemotaxis protein CheW [Planctomycetes bacterium]|nr:chemotaxis protein CheW [Planctomycetota bacterium]
MSNDMTIEQVNNALTERAGKYLTFALANEEYGLEILKVREIFGYMDITAVPQTPGYVKGVINLRGQVIPVIDLRAKFGMETTEVTEETCIIVVEITQDDQKFSTGIVVDHVQEVLDIAGEDIEESPQFDSSVNTDFILGMGKIGDTVKILLDIDKVLNSVDLVKFAGAAKKATKTTAKDAAKETDAKQEVSTDTSTEKGDKDE